MESKVSFHNWLVYFTTILTGDDTPDWRDLQRNVVSQYAVHWKVIAAELGLEHYHIANISENHYHNIEDGCATMLRKWLADGTSPTWGALDDAINRVLQVDCPNSSSTAGG